MLDKTLWATVNDTILTITCGLSLEYLEFHEYWSMIAEADGGDFAKADFEVGGDKDEIEFLLRPKRGKGGFADGVDAVVADGGKGFVELANGIFGGARAAVEVAAEDGLAALWVGGKGVDVVDEFGELADASFGGTKVEMQVDHGKDNCGADAELGVEKAFFPEGGGAEGKVVPFEDGKIA